MDSVYKFPTWVQLFFLIPKGIFWDNSILYLSIFKIYDRKSSFERSIPKSTNVVSIYRASNN